MRSSRSQLRCSGGGHNGGRRGFTLLELVLVMLVIAIVLGLAAPSLRNFWRAAEARDAGLQFLSVARYAQTRAVADSVVYRLNIDPSGTTYHLSVQDGVEFIELATSFGQEFTIPRDGRIELLPVRSPFNSQVIEVQGKNYIDFFPDGRTEPALVRIDDGSSRTLIECSSPAEPFRILGQEEAERR